MTTFTSLTDTFTLANGYRIPCVGFGTWQTPDGETAVQAVKDAIDLGYRHIDTAAVYGNEKSVGKGIAESGVDRSDLFVTSKLWNAERGYETTLRAFEQSLADLGTDYLDLYLIHWPANSRQFGNWQELNSETWRAFEDLYEAGKIKAIGLSNFTPNFIEPLLEKARIAPMVDQLEYHPGYMQREAVSFCQEHDILVQAWSPLGSGRVLSDPDLARIAGTYGTSVAQLCVRWVLQNGVLPLPKSVTRDRIAENARVFDFEIAADDTAFINAMSEMGFSGMHPDEIEF